MLLGKLLVDFAELDLTLLLVWVAVYYGLRPLDRLTRQVEGQSARELQRFDEADVPGELRPLIVAFNRVLELLHDAAQAQQRFVADAAHQMRTPVAGLLAQLELLLSESGGRRRCRRSSARCSAACSSWRARPISCWRWRAPSRSRRCTENFKPVALKPLVEQLVERYVDRADKAGIDLGAEARAAQRAGRCRAARGSARESDRQCAQVRAAAAAT